MKETKEQKEKRRILSLFNNAKKDWWARRKNKDRWIMGRRYTPNEIMAARKRHIEEMEEYRRKMKEQGKRVEEQMLKAQKSLWFRIKMWFRRLKIKLKGRKIII